MMINSSSHPWPELTHQVTPLHSNINSTQYSANFPALLVSTFILSSNSCATSKTDSLSYHPSARTNKADTQLSKKELFNYICCHDMKVLLLEGYIQQTLLLPLSSSLRSNSPDVVETCTAE